MSQYLKTYNKREMPELNPGNSKCFQLEIFILFGLLILLILFNLATHSRFPIVWIDEAAYTDPSANLYLGNGFTSSMWYAQGNDKFWAGNVPLHQIILYGWMRLFGFSLLTVRSFNYFVITAAAILLWLAVIRLNLVTSIWYRITLIATILLGYGVAINYRSARPDGICILLASAALLAYSIRSIRLRCILLVCIGVLFPIAGLQLCIYTVILCCLLLIFLGNSFLKEAGSLAVGIIIGVAFLYILYSANGVWDGFIASIAPHRAVGVASSYKGSNYLLKRISGQSFSKDPSFLFLFSSLVALTVYKIKIGSFRLRSLLSFGLVASICIPVGMFSLGVFPTYYSWMVFIPLSIIVFSVLAKLRFNWKKSLHLVCLLFLLLTCLSGLPLQAASAISRWDGRDYSVVESLVEKNLKNGDWVYADASAYFAAKKKAGVVFSKHYLKRAKSPERDKISILIIDPDEFEEITNKLGGQWFIDSDIIGSSNKKNSKFSNVLFHTYHLQVFRRESRL